MPPQTQLDRLDVAREVGHLLLMLWEREKRITELEAEVVRLQPTKDGDEVPA